MKNGSRGIGLREIAVMLGCAPPPGELRITGVASLVDAGPSDISFLGSEAFVKEFNATAAGAVLVQKNIHLLETPRTIVLTVTDADLAMAKVLEAFAPEPVRPPPGIDAQAVVDPTAKIGADVSVGAFCVVGAGAQIGKGSVIHPLVFIGKDVVIGEDCEIFPNVTIRERIRIGSRVTINAGSVLGTDGFGYRWDGTRQAKIPQIGNVVIGDDVEIGSCVCIDRAKFSVTQIGRGTKIDNLVQIGHNVVIGEHCVIAGQAGLAGSAVLGTRVSLGGQSALRDHTRIGDGAMVAACAAVANDVDAKEIVSGMPAIPHRQSLRENAAQRRLPDLVVTIRKLKEEVEELKAKLGQPSEPQKK